MIHVLHIILCLVIIRFYRHLKQVYAWSVFKKDSKIAITNCQLFVCHTHFNFSSNISFYWQEDRVHPPPSMLSDIAETLGGGLVEFCFLIGFVFIYIKQ